MDSNNSLHREIIAIFVERHNLNIDVPFTHEDYERSVIKQSPFDLHQTMTLYLNITHIVSNEDYNPHTKEKDFHKAFADLLKSFYGDTFNISVFKKDKKTRLNILRQLAFLAKKLLLKHLTAITQNAKDEEIENIVNDTAERYVNLYNIRIEGYTLLRNIFTENIKKQLVFTNTPECTSNPNVH